MAYTQVNKQNVYTSGTFFSCFRGRNILFTDLPTYVYATEIAHYSLYIDPMICSTHMYVRTYAQSGHIHSSWHTYIRVSQILQYKINSNPNTNTNPCSLYCVMRFILGTPLLCAMTPHTVIRLLVACMQYTHL